MRNLKRCFTVIFVILGLFTASARAASYSVQDLGVMPGLPENGIYVMGINNRSQVTGTHKTNLGNLNAFSLPDYNWVVTDLGTLSNGPNSGAMAINNNGQIAGWSIDNSYNQHPVLYSNGTITDLGNFGGNGGSSAYAINDNGQIAGLSYTNTGAYHAFLYSTGTMTDLGTLGGAK